MGGVSRGSPEGGCGGGGNPAAADNDVGGGGKRTAKQGRLVELNFEVHYSYSVTRGEPIPIPKESQFRFLGHF